MSFPLRPRIYLELKCSLECPYCATRQGCPDVKYRSSLPAIDWTRRLQRLHDLGWDAPIFTGGEPTLHPGFVEIIDNHPWDKPITVYTNLRGRMSARHADPDKVKWTATFHECDNPKRFAVAVELFRKKGHRIKLKYIERFLAVIPDIKNAHWHAKPFQASPEPMEGPVKCQFPVAIFGPKGRRYHCVSYMLQDRPPGGVGALPCEEGCVEIQLCEDTPCTTCDVVATRRPLP